MKLRHASVISAGLVLAACTLSACGNAEQNPSKSSTSPANSPTNSAAAQEKAMNIDEGQAHYRSIVAQVRDRLTCTDGAPLTWREDRPESIEAAGDLRDDGQSESYVYRAPFLISPTSCTGQEFEAAVKQISAILDEAGGIDDEVSVAADRHDWKDAYGASFSFGSGKATTFTMHSAELPNPG